jgi:dTDP-glucose 4,6-dehydratase
MKILVTGGAGFIGSNFIRHLLLQSNHEIINLDNLTYAGNLSNLGDVAGNPRYHFTKGDICEATVVAQALKGCDSVVHFAAESHVDRSIFQPDDAMRTNIIGTFVLLKLVRELKVERFVHISTDEIYGDLPSTVTADESFPLRPSSPYSASKASADLIVGSFVRTFSLPAIIIRASNNYGPYQFPEKFLPLLICNALEEKPLPIYGDGLQQRNWLHVEDHCRAILAVLEKGKPGETYNVGGPDVVDNLQLAQRVLVSLGKPQSLIQHVEDRPGHDRRYALSSKKINAELGWHSQITLEEGLRQTINWYQENKKWIAETRNGEYREYYRKYYDNRVSALRDLFPSGPMGSA